MILLGGCTAEPKYRLGALPFPGLGLYSVADPDDLGRHRYRSLFPMFDRERERGVIYTTRCGFVDVAHIRHAADWTRRSMQELHPALIAGEDQVAFEATDRTRVHVEIDYPPGWYVLSPARREALCFELALRQSQRLSYALGTWHEAITWLGFQTIPLISEKHSAFTYDDIVAHLLGVRAAARALRSDEPNYNRAMTAAIEVELARAGALSSGETRKAIEAVEGSWWTWGKAIKRHLDPAVVDGFLSPMLVPGYARDGSRAERREDPMLQLPTLETVDASPLTPDGLFWVRFDPQFSQWDEIRALLPGHPDWLDPDIHLPVLVDVVRQGMREEIGPNVDSLSPPTDIATILARQQEDRVGWSPQPAGERQGVTSRQTREN